MYGISLKAIPKSYYQEPISTEERLRTLKQWREDVLIAHQYAQDKMKSHIKTTCYIRRPFGGEIS